jgi:hypothetical protein
LLFKLSFRHTARPLPPQGTDWVRAEWIRQIKSSSKGRNRSIFRTDHPSILFLSSTVDIFTGESVTVPLHTSQITSIFFFSPPPRGFLLLEGTGPRRHEVQRIVHLPFAKTRSFPMAHHEVWCRKQAKLSLLMDLKTNCPGAI